MPQLKSPADQNQVKEGDLSSISPQPPRPVQADQSRMAPPSQPPPMGFFHRVVKVEPSSPDHTLALRILGPLATLATAVAIELLSESGWVVPAPAAVLMVPVLFAAARGGMVPGLLSAAILVLYEAWFHSMPGRVLRYTDEEHRRLLLLGLISPIAVVVGARMRALLRRERTARAEAESASRALRESEARLAAVFDQVTAGIAQTDLTGRFVRVNQRYCELAGRPNHELLGMRMQDITHPEDLPENLRLFQRLAAGGPNFMIEKRYIRPDGTSIWVNNSVSAVKDEGGTPRHIVAVVLDVTERRRAEAAVQESEQRFRQLANTVPSFVWTAAPDGTITYANEKWYEYSGLTPEQTAVDWVQALHPDDLERCAAAWAAALKQGTDYEIKVRNRRADGEYRWFLTRALPLRDEHGRITGWFGTSTDIEEQKRAEAAMQRLNQELERRVAERTAELQDSFNQLEGFSYTVAHDLRAPLRAIEGFTGIMLDEFGEHLDEAGHHYANRIKQATTRMDLLIRDLLAYSRLSRVDLERGPVVLRSAVQEALGQLQEELRSSDALVDIGLGGTEIRVLAHQPTLVQVISNLVANAAKFVASERRPEIRFRAELTERGVRLWVEDNGIGIAPAHQERIFRVFERLHSSDRYPGTGVGLAIVRKGIERMSGRVGVKSELGRGSKFWIELEKA